MSIEVSWLPITQTLVAFVTINVTVPGHVFFVRATYYNYIIMLPNKTEVTALVYRRPQML